MLWIAPTTAMPASRPSLTVLHTEVSTQPSAPPAFQAMFSAIIFAPNNQLNVQSLTPLEDVFSALLGSRFQMDFVFSPRLVPQRNMSTPKETASKVTSQTALLTVLQMDNAQPVNPASLLTQDSNA